ncbi:MAG: response regulator transcription factor [Bradymonadales bacterium]|jgi:two-component system alkaline phosphatase synthesis response regulator PhoP
MIAREKAKIMIVEDDEAISRGLMHNLQYEGYETRLVSHGNAFFPIMEAFKPDLIVLDLMLPGMSGFEILEKLRPLSNVVVVILSAKSQEEDKVKGLKLGADDYIAKPFGLKEFLARIEANLRRIKSNKVESQLCFGDISVNLETKLVEKKGVAIKLTPKALELFLFFVSHPKRIYSREDLLHYVWDDRYDGTARTIDNFISQIRNQIEDNPQTPQHLETVHGLGYRFHRDT